MKEEALKLADELAFHQGELSMWTRNEACRMIRRLVEELDYLKDQISFYELKDLGNQIKPLSDEEIEYYEHLIAKLFNCSTTQKVIGLDRVIRAIEERHGIK